MLLLRGLPAAAQAAAPTAPAASTAPVMGTKDDRVFWVVPNYRTVDQERNLPSITARDKMTIAAKDSFDPFAFPIAGLFAGIDYAEDQDSSWGRGAGGYGKRYIAAFADQTVGNVMTEGLFPVALHEDPRYFRLGRGGVLHRTGYAIGQIFVTRTDSGGEEFNCSEFGGNAVAAAAGNLYYPKDDRTVGGAASRFGAQMGFDLIANVAKEFWPDIKNWLTGK